MATGEGEPTTLLAAWEAGNASALGRARRLLAVSVLPSHLAYR